MTFSERRVLHEYPRGAHRWTLLLTVLATILASYEFQLSPLLPLLLPAIHLSQIGRLSVGGMVIYMVAMLLTRPHRSVHAVTAAQPQRRAMA